MLVSRLLTALALPHGFTRDLAEAPPLWRPRQVHGVRIVAAREPGAGPEDADGTVSDVPQQAAGIVTADCIPLLVAADDGRVVGAVHAGWRGIAAGIVEAGVAAVCAAAGRGDAAGLVAAVGPAAAGCCYEVDDAVLDAVRPAADLLAPTRPGHARVDLRGVVVDRLEAAGIPGSGIEVVGPCTICSADWPSYRREGAAAGRILSWIAPDAGPRGERLR